MSKRKRRKSIAKKNLPKTKAQTKRQSYLTWVGASGLAIAIILFVASVYGLGEDNDVFRSYDFREIFTYQKSYYKESLLEGRLPLWNPYTFSGWPFTANALVQAFYPTSLLFLILPQSTAVIIDLILHLFLGMAGMYFLLRITFRVRRESAAFGALVYALSGSFIAHAYAGHIQFYTAALYTPLLMLAVDRSVTFLSQHKEAPNKTSRSSRPLLGRAGAWLWAGSLLLGLQILSGGLPFVWLAVLMIGLFRLGALLCTAPRNIRAWWRECIVLIIMISIAAGLAVVQLAPTYELVQLCNRPFQDYDYAATGSYHPKMLRTLLFARAEVEGIKHFWEYYGYVGLLPMVIAVIGLIQFRNDPRIAVFAVIGVLTLLFMFGNHSFLFPTLWKYVPGFNIFRAPARAIVNLNFILALLAAVGLEAIIGWLSQRRTTPPRWILLIALLACAVTWVDITLAARANRGRMFLQDRSFLERPFHLQHEKILKNDGSWYRYWFRRALFRQNHAFQVNRRSIGGYDNMFLQRYSRFIHHMTDTPIVPSLVTILTQKTFTNTPSPSPFKILGVKYADYKNRIVERKDPENIKRAWFVTRARRVENEEAALKYMHSNQFQPFQEVVLEAPEADQLNLPTESNDPSASSPKRRIDIKVHELSPEHLQIKLEPHPPGYLVLSEIFYPGWYASADGHNVPIYRADSILRCVPLDANVREVDMLFKPATLRYGAWISAAFIILVIAGFWFSRHKTLNQ